MGSNPPSSGEYMIGGGGIHGHYNKFFTDNYDGR